MLTWQSAPEGSPFFLPLVRKALFQAPINTHSQAMEVYREGKVSFKPGYVSFTRSGESCTTFVPAFPGAFLFNFKPFSSPKRRMRVPYLRNFFWMFGIDIFLKRMMYDNPQNASGWFKLKAQPKKQIFIIQGESDDSP